MAAPLPLIGLVLVRVVFVFVGTVFVGTVFVDLVGVRVGVAGQRRARAAPAAGR